ncbi:hypothetical protein [uncultured Lacinutrix sp.]|uniref:hypothetical protein n=1 Tax=uncultured Lacinutrix sp. TaxID=574032 RepID=UPI0026151B08|nr:hypothetical protein [uncultured Lacinutrix sp.]
MKNQLWLLFIVFSVLENVHAQEAIPFKTQNEFYIYGDATVIGNNILSKNATQPFNDQSVVNDDIDMVFVDIDKDQSTFSSSSANLKLPKNFTKIKYAALYWSATYSYEQGYRQETNGQFLFQGKRVRNRNEISKVKLKLPNGTYKNINGKVIFDGVNDTAFTLNSPYVCMANVTKLFRNANTLNGQYTVANIKATKGFVSGGSAGGWLLYVVYEAPTKNPKYITTYNGFAHVSGTPVRLKFKNFKSLEKGDAKTALTFAALEGDSALKEDECIIVNKQSKKVALLSTNNRPRNNFFNSTITHNDNLFNERKPNSENTLGFDIISMDLSNNSQQIVDNTTTEVEMAFNTESDRFYLFFTAFQTEISKVFYEENKENAIVELEEDKGKIIVEAKPKQIKKPKKVRVKKEKKRKPKKIKKPKIKETVAKSKSKKEKEKPQPKIFVPKKEVTQASIKEYKPDREEKPLPIWLKRKETEAVTTEDNIYRPEGLKTPPKRSKSGLVLNRENYEKVLTKEDYVYETQSFKRVLNQDPTYVEGVEKGYYIIADVLSDLDEAILYQNELKKRGVNSRLFKDTPNEKYYVYLYNSENFYDVFMLRKAFIKSLFLEDVWILNINIYSKIIKKI